MDAQQQQLPFSSSHFLSRVAIGYSHTSAPSYVPIVTSKVPPSFFTQGCSLLINSDFLAWKTISFPLVDTPTRLFAKLISISGIFLSQLLTVRICLGHSC